jgi:hypothetical protein
MTDLEVPLRFEGLLRRLLHVVEQRVRNGETTERALAREIQVSQPHMHNICSGHRALTTDVGDDLLAHFDLSLLDLCADDEIFHHLMSRGRPGRRSLAVPLLRGRLGPGWPFPDPALIDDWVSVRSVPGEPLRTPVLVAISDDSSLPSEFQGSGKTALLECAPEARIRIARDGWYAVRTSEGEAIRQLRKVTAGLLILRQTTLFEEHRPGEPPISFAQQLRFVRGQVRWIGEDPRRSASLDQAGWLRSPAESR